MRSRRKFVQNVGMLTLAAHLDPFSLLAGTRSDFVSNRPALKDRKFTSTAVNEAIEVFKKGVSNKEIGWLFENCFPNTLDTTVDFEMIDGKPDTYVITGDIDAMWLRDSCAQVWPYLPMMRNDPHLKSLIEGVIRRQTTFIHLDPYANAFYKDPSKVSEWKESDLTEMKPGVHERKWEIDSLCYPIRLAFGYWKETGDIGPFDNKWKEGIVLTLKTFKEQQRKTDQGPYKFQRRTAWATDGVPLGGYGYPTKPVGLINSMFRPSDDATIFPFLIPSNYFALVSLEQAAEMVSKISGDNALAAECIALSKEIKFALDQFARVMHPQIGEVFAYEVNGFGSFNLMDDANVPSLLSLPYLGVLKNDDETYKNTRKLLLSGFNPFYFKGKAGEGIGGPHAGMDMIWPLSITMRGLTSRDDFEIKKCIELLVNCHAGTGFMHESFHKDDASNFTRKWFAWANTIFGEFLWKVYREKPELFQ